MEILLLVISFTRRFTDALGPFNAVFGILRTPISVHLCSENYDVRCGVLIIFCKKLVNYVTENLLIEWVNSNNKALENHNGNCSAYFVNDNSP